MQPSVNSMYCRRAGTRPDISGVGVVGKGNIPSIILTHITHTYIIYTTHTQHSAIHVPPELFPLSEDHLDDVVSDSSTSVLHAFASSLQSSLSSSFSSPCGQNTSKEVFNNKNPFKIVNALNSYTFSMRYILLTVDFIYTVPCF